MIAALMLGLAPLAMQGEALSALSLAELAARLPKYGEPYQERGPGGDWTVRPALAEFRKRLQAGETPSAGDWQAIIVGGGYLHSRPKWPAGEPWAVRFHAPPLEECSYIDLLPLRGQWPKVRASRGEMLCGLGTDGMRAREDFQELGLLPLGKHEIEFAIEIHNPDWTRGAKEGELRVYRAGPIRLQVEIVDEFESVLSAADGADLDEWIRRGLSVDLRHSSDGAGVVLALDAAGWPPSVARDVEWELLRDGVVCSKGVMFRARGRRTEQSDVLRQLPRSVVLRQKSADPWSLRVRGVRAYALGEWQTTRYWNGEITLPVAELLR